MTDPDRRVPSYLGRILDAVGTPVGTCFQVADGVLVTAWHVLDDLDAGGHGDEVMVDALADSHPPASARVAQVDPLHDLAVLICSKQLTSTIGMVGVTDTVDFATPVVVTGVATVDDGGHQYRFLDAVGHWRGGTTRDMQVPLGRLGTESVTPGMSGAPVRRIVDDVVIGVVSARYNSTDGWLRDSVWVARIEDLMPLLAGVAEVPLAGNPVDGSQRGDAIHELRAVHPHRAAKILTERPLTRATVLFASVDERTAAEVADELGPTRLVAILSEMNRHRAALFIEHMSAATQSVVQHVPVAAEAVLRCWRERKDGLGDLVSSLEIVGPSKRGTSGFVRRCAAGAVFWTKEFGALAVQGAAEAYARTDEVMGSLGFPIAAESAAEHSRFQTEGSYQRFEAAKSAIYWTGPGNAYILLGDIASYYEREGCSGGPLGFPKSDAHHEGATSSGLLQQFEGGAVCRTNAGIFTLSGQLLKYYREHQNSNSRGWHLDLPLGEQQTVVSQHETTGVSQLFGFVEYALSGIGCDMARLGVSIGVNLSNSIWGEWKISGEATVYSSGQYGAIAVWGSIRDLYRKLGSVEKVGFPTGEVVAGAAPGSDPKTQRHCQRFEGGVIFSEQSCGTHLVSGGVLELLDEHEGIAEQLGFPTSSEESIGHAQGSRIQFFEGGVVTVRSNTAEYWPKPKS